MITYIIAGIILAGFLFLIGLFIYAKINGLTDRIKYLNMFLIWIIILLIIGLAKSL
jgi:hypothetical protein